MLTQHSENPMDISSVAQWFDPCHVLINNIYFTLINFACTVYVILALMN